MKERICLSDISEQNTKHTDALEHNYSALGETLARDGLDIEHLTEQAIAFEVTVPSWGVGTGGTRFARFPRDGEPRNIFEKVEDCAVIHQLCRCTPRVSPHFPWDVVGDFSELRQHADQFGLGWDSVNSNTFQDQSDQKHSYKYGSLSHTSQAVRDQAVAHNLDCIEYGKELGSKILTVWIADGSNHPGQQHFQRAFERYL
ncbi:MAG: sugar isomerase, partial [Gammaproteobacteria bacterium]